MGMQMIAADKHNAHLRTGASTVHTNKQQTVQCTVHSTHVLYICNNRSYDFFKSKGCVSKFVLFLGTPLRAGQ